MKIVLVGLFCLFFSFSILGQNETKFGITEITLFRDNGKGKAGEETLSFSTIDRPIHCSIELDSTESAVIKMNMVAVNVPGLKSGKVVVSASYKTSGEDDAVNFTASPRTVWTAGKYRMDIFIDDKLGASKEFEIKESSPPKKEETKSFQPETKTAKQNRKN
ncbi:MAG TPA: hypothetical protein VK892_14480 [Pyrinomonadaceae bacterium]|nr:hypothetical protein [Pyrinomonadaceae bacterium]